MTEHLLIESQGPWAGPGCSRFVEDALALAGLEHDVCLFLIQNGVVAAVPGAVPPVSELVRSGGTVVVDRFSLGQRGFDAGDLLPEVEVVEIDSLAERLLEPATRSVWH